ncbi:MAG TPA: hypothetical protein ENJ19_01025, partial [Gammaproteobacteria bacterium]|nr:hypothetical protein [Gammaproteobacteria bacterium]
MDFQHRGHIPFRPPGLSRGAHTLRRLAGVALLWAVTTAAALAATIAGTAYTDEGITNIGAGKTVRLLVNGSSAGTAVTDASGNYSINASVGVGDAIVLYIDGNDGATDDATTVTVSPGGNLANIDLYKDHLIVRHDNSGSLTNALMSTARGAYSDSEILYSVSAGALTVSGSATELYLPGGHSFAPGGDVTAPGMESLGTFNGGSGTVDINGALLISGGSFTATSATTRLAGDFTIAAGSFSHNSGTVLFHSNATRAVSTGTATMNHVQLDMSGGNLNITGTLDINGNLTLTNVNNINTGTIAVAGNVVTTDGDVRGDGKILFDGANQELYVDKAGGQGDLPGVEVNNTGTLTVFDTIGIHGSSGWTYTGGAVDMLSQGATLLVASAGTITVNDSTTTFNNVELNMSGGVVDVTGTLDINGNLTLTSVNSINTGTIAVAGNVVTTDGDVRGDGKILFDGVNQELYADKAGGRGDLPGLEINNTGTLTVFDTIGIHGSSGWTYTGGAVDTVSQGATVVFAGPNTIAVNDSTTVFNSVELDMSGGVLNVTGTLDVNGPFKITAVNTINTGTVRVAGDVITLDTGVAGTGHLLFDGVNQSLRCYDTVPDPSCGGAIPGIEINNTGTLTLYGTIELDGNYGWVRTGGTVDATSNGTTVVFDISQSGTPVFNDGATTLNHVILDMAGRSLSITGTMNVGGNFTLTGVNNIDTGTIAIAGDLSATDTGVGGTAAMTLYGTGTQSINVTGDLPDGTFTIYKASGTVVLLTDFTTALDGAGQDLTITQGTLDLNGYNLTVPHVLTVDANGTLQLEGGETLTTTSTTFNA